MVCVGEKEWHQIAKKNGCASHGVIGMVYAKECPILDPMSLSVGDPGRPVPGFTLTTIFKCSQPAAPP